MIREIASVTGSVIATGGGAILRAENIQQMRMNGKIFFLDRPVEQLIPTDDRPLSATKEMIMKRYNERYPIYLATADVRIKNNDTSQTAVQLVKKEFLA